MPTHIPLPSGATATFVTPDELTFRQEERLTKAAGVLHAERVAYAVAQGKNPEDLSARPGPEEMARIDLGPFERHVAGVVCLDWSHPVNPPSADPAHEEWMDDPAFRADARAVLSEAVRLLPMMMDFEVEGAPFDASSDSPTTSTPTPPSTSPTTNGDSSPSGDSSTSPDGPSPRSKRPPSASAPASSASKKATTAP